MINTPLAKMLVRAFVALFIFWVHLPPAASAQTIPSTAEVGMAYEAAVTNNRMKLSEYQTIFAWMTSTFGKEKWLEIRWRQDLWQARIESAASGKPIFIWAMNGDPLGCV